MLEVDSNTEATFNCYLLFCLTPTCLLSCNSHVTSQWMSSLTYSPIQVYNYTIASHGNFIWVCLHPLDPLGVQQQWIPNNIRWIMLGTEYCIPSNLYTEDPSHSEAVFGDKASKK